MCSAWAIRRPRASKRAVEQSRRSLMLAEKAERMRAAPISSATARRALPSTWSSIFTMWSSFREGQYGTIPNPHPPGGEPARCAGELDQLRAGGVDRLAWREADLRASADVRRPHRDQLDLPLRIGVSVPLLVRAVEALHEARPQRHCELERLPAITQIRIALAGQLPRVGQRAHVRTDVVAPLVARHQSERR